MEVGGGKRTEAAQVSGRPRVNINTADREAETREETGPLTSPEDRDQLVEAAKEGPLGSRQR